MLFPEFEKKYPVIVRSLQHSANNGKMAHSYLINSSSAQLRRDFPQYLAALKICKDRNACGECDMCRRLKRETYPELYHLYPEGKSWQIRIGDNLNAKENTIRHFENLFYLTGTSGFTWKIGIIHDADRMNVQAQNAFLKTLEEPPENTMFILTTGNPQSLLPTTRSRCQMLFLPEHDLKFSFDGAGQLFECLHKLQTTTLDDLGLAGNCAESIIAISGAMESTTSGQLRENWQHKFSYAEEQGPGAVRQLEESFASAARGEYLKQRRAFECAIHTYFAQSYLLSLAGNSGITLTNPEVFDSLDTTAICACGEKRILQHLEAAEQLLFNLRFNVNEKLALRSFCLKLLYS